MSEMENLANQESVAASEPAESPSEKMLRQSEVNEVVGRVRHEGYEKGRKDAMAELQRMQQMQNQTPEPQAQPSSMGGMSNMDEGKVRDLIAQESLRQQQIASAHHIAQSFAQKLSNGKDKYADFDDVVRPLDVSSIPHIVQLANDMDNTADIMYDLGKNPHKIASLTTLMHTAPHLAQLEMKKLSNSIRVNEDAKNQSLAKEPLGQLKPSTVSTGNGPMTLTEFKRADWLRG